MSSNQEPQSIPAYATVTTNTTPDEKGRPIERTAIVLNTLASVDIITPNGQLICRINGFYHAQDPDKNLPSGTIDVILLNEGLQGQFIAFSNGAPVVNCRPEGVTVYTVAISPK